MNRSWNDKWYMSLSEAKLNNFTFCQFKAIYETETNVSVNFGFIV